MVRIRREGKSRKIFAGGRESGVGKQIYKHENAGYKTPIRQVFFTNEPDDQLPEGTR